MAAILFRPQCVKIFPTGWIYPHDLGLLHWHRDNLMIVTVPVKGNLMIVPVPVKGNLMIVPVPVKGNIMIVPVPVKQP